MATAGPIRDSRVSRRVHLLQELVQHVDSIIQIVAVRFTDGDMEFTSESRAEDLPILLKDKTKIISLPMTDRRFVDDACLGIPQRDRTAICPTRPICSVPRAPLLT